MATRLSHVVRRKFVDYFTTKHGHVFVKSSCVRPPESDRTLSFVNAGMNQFKEIFTADEARYTPNRVCNYQKCIRVGGKSCDLDQVGRNLRHHTFFEMLGNWSFNSYSTPSACEWALDFLLNHLALDMEKLSVTYYADDTEEDVSTKDNWIKLGFKPDRVLANKKGDNFWEMGSSGPCGRSTEIFYTSGGEPLEIWNIVTIDRHKLKEPAGKIVPLKGKFIDTGMGLERILSVLEGVNSNYDTDLFRPLFSAIEAKSSVDNYSGSLDKQLDIDYRILADHCRMITVALSDGIKPGRRGNSFNLRSVIKKAFILSRDTFQQETPRYLLFDLVDETIGTLSSAYPELLGSVKYIRRTLAAEWKSAERLTRN